jgi:hypothetical protein
MPDHKETGRQPTEREREAAFAPHDSPERQPDGDPGEKRPRVIHDDDKANENDEGETAGDRGQWDNEPG